MLAGLERPTKGEVIISGSHIEKLKEDDLVRFRRENVGFIFQSFHLIGTMNALENVALPLMFRGEAPKVRIKKADRMLDMVGLSRHKKHMPNQMSGGQQQSMYEQMELDGGTTGLTVTGKSDGGMMYSYSIGTSSEEEPEKYITDETIKELKMLDHVKSADPVLNYSALALKGKYEGYIVRIPSGR